MKIIRTVQLLESKILLDGECVFSYPTASGDFLTEAYKQLEINYPKFYKMDRMSKAGFLGAEYLLKGISLDEISPYKKGIVLQNISSSLETDRKYQESIQYIASPALFVYTLPNIVMGEIAIRHGFKGENTFFVASNHDLSGQDEYINLLFKERIVDICICGEIESGSIIFELRSNLDVAGIF